MATSAIQTFLLILYSDSHTDIGISLYFTLFIN